MAMSMIRASFGLFVHLVVPTSPFVIAIISCFYVSNIIKMIISFFVASLASWLLWWIPSDPSRLVYVDMGGPRSEDASLTKNKILIVGAGFSGLAVAAEFSRKCIPYDLFDEGDAIGGQWYKGGYKNVHIISSKRVTEYKDYPMPSHYPQFPSKKQMWEYLTDYANRWGIMSSVHLNTKVSAIKANDMDGTSYTVTSTRGKEVYKGVVVCVGHHWIKRDVHATYPGKFTGDVMHSSEYSSSAQLEGKKILVVGSGNSAMDIVCDGAREAVEAHISTRHGIWFTPRCVFGRPSLEIMPAWIPMWLQRFLMETITRISTGNPEDLHLQKPNHRWGEIHPTISSMFIELVRMGSIIPHPGIQSFEGKTVKFTDGTSLSVDLIVYCTGYLARFPLLESTGLMTVDKTTGLPELINSYLIPNKKNCFVVGIQQPRYGAGPLLTRAAQLTSALVEAQEKTTLPISTLLVSIVPWIVKIAERPSKRCDDFLVDPHTLCKEMQVFQSVAPFLPWVEQISDYLRRLGERPQPKNISKKGGKSV